ncbi:MAG: DNA-formamidopyrimidine glycosylase, partial [Cyanobacteria bacterium P01_A01_bin.37]
MPELPEVETVRRGLNRVTLMQPIRGGDVLLDRTVAYPDSIEKFLNGLQGCAIAQWHRRGKYLLAQLVQPISTQPISTQAPFESPESSEPPESLPGGWLGVHLRMTGQLLWLDQDEPLQKHCRIRLFFDQHRELRFVDQRTFGQLWWVSPDIQPEEVMGGYAHLGPEPLSDEFSVECLTRSLKRRHRPIKNALLDQRIVAGLGNIYADESLFMSRVRPTRLCDRLTRKQFESLHENIITV